MSKALKVLVIHQEPSKIEDLENFQNNRHGYLVQYVHCPEDLKHYKNNFTNDNFDGFLVQSNGNTLGKDIFKLVEQQKTTDAGETVYKQKIEEVYELNTDWLRDYEIEQLEELWTSPDTYIQIGDNHYPVININKAAVIKNKKTPGVFKYKITVRIATKNR